MNVLGSTKVLGVFGHPISHSLSPVMHNAAIKALNIDYIYVPFHVMPNDLEKAVDGIRSLDISGVNVTIPHKEQVIKYLDEVSEYALQIGSVNTIINENGRLKGDTTDGPGFLKSVEAVWGKIDGSKVMILGAGGSAKAISYALARINCKVVIANRTEERAKELSESLNAACGNDLSKAIGLHREELAEELHETNLLVNTTSVGMHPDVDGIPLPPDLLHPGLKVYDLVYNPLKTRFVSEARSRKIEAVTGLGMLIYQGALSFEMWTGKKAPIIVMEEALSAHFRSS